MKRDLPSVWTPAESAELYGIRSWGAGYFDLADDGTVHVTVPLDGKRVGVSLMSIIAALLMPFDRSYRRCVPAAICFVPPPIGRCWKGVWPSPSHRAASGNDY